MDSKGAFQFVVVSLLHLANSRDACVPPGESINASSGYISSPNFPNNYDANRICTWNITVPSGRIIKLTFLSFTLVANENEDCSGAASTSARLLITNVASHGGDPNNFKLCGQKSHYPVYSKGNFIQVRFESRTGPLNKGFNASFEAIDGDSLCPTDMILNETSGSFSSPFNPRNYPFNQTCSWNITGKQGYRVELTIPDYNLHQCDAICSCDYLEVQSSFSDDAQAGKLCGSPRNIVNLTFYSIHESLRMVFVSDDTKFDYDGFGATYKLLNYSPPICPKEAIPLSGSGKISSTNYPKSNYTASRNCTWSITAPADKKVKFLFTDFVLSECSAQPCSDSCSYVELYDGGSTSSPSLGRFCQGSSWDEPRFSSGNQMFVMFHPGLTVARGFEAEYKYTTTGVCPKEAIPLSGSGKISSTNYPKSNYTASRNCTWNITASANETVKFEFTYFVLSECLANHCSDSCSYVELYDGGFTSSPSLGRFCQGSSWNETKFSTGNQLFVTFHPGQTVDRGFEAEYSVSSLTTSSPPETETKPRGETSTTGESTTTVGTPSETSLSTAAYVGIGIGSVAALAVIFVAICVLRRQNGEHEMNTVGEAGNKNYGAYNFDTGQVPVYHAPNTGKQSVELGSFSNGGYAG